MADNKDTGPTNVSPSKAELENRKPDKNYQPATTGAVLDPNDGRLKENRESGTTLGTTAHSATAPNMGRSDDAEKGINSDK